MLSSVCLFFLFGSNSCAAMIWWNRKVESTEIAFIRIMSTEHWVDKISSRWDGVQFQTTWFVTCNPTGATCFKIRTIVKKPGSHQKWNKWQTKKPGQNVCIFKNFKETWEERETEQSSPRNSRGKTKCEEFALVTLDTTVLQHNIFVHSIPYNVSLILSAQLATWSGLASNAEKKIAYNYGKKMKNGEYMIAQMLLCG